MGVVLSDPETGDPLASAKTVEVARQGTGWIVYVAAADVRHAALARAARRIHDQLLERGASARDSACQVVIDAVNLTDQRRGQTLQDVQLIWQPRAEGPHLAVDFRVAGWPMTRPARFVATRNRQADPPLTSWELDTGPQDLPCQVLAAAFPPLAALGEEALVGGELTLTPNESGWEGRGHGRLARIDLDQLLTGRFPHKLTGEADVDLTRIEWQAGRVVDAAGTVTSAGGVVSYSLLAAAAAPDGLRLTIPDRVRDGKQPLWKYSELALGFDLSDQGLQLTGRCRDEAPGTLLADQRGALAVEPAQELLSVIGLVRTLAPQNEIQVPASAQTERLLRWLPLPSLVPVNPAVARPGYSPLRLR